MGWPEDQNAQAVGVKATIRPTDSTLEARLRTVVARETYGLAKLSISLRS